MRVAVFTDFDGTITLDDCNDALVSRYLGPERRVEYDEAFSAGRMVLWRLLDASLRACAVPLDEAIGYLHACVRLDPGFAPFHAWCVARGIPVEVVSAGTEAVVRSFLEAEGLDVPVIANHAAMGDACFGLDPRDAGCPTGVDKAAIVVAAREAGYFTVFVGDGFSDRLAAPHADLVYAKGQLARWCAKKGLPHVPVAGFAEIQADLARRLDAS
jgi:2,3-diketo-5-methylthio-1-phosphopentane phosphatase